MQKNPQYKSPLRNFAVLLLSLSLVGVAMFRSTSLDHKSSEIKAINNSSCTQDCCAKLSSRNPTTYTYYQDTGRFIGGQDIAYVETVGYSEIGQGFNNPKAQCLKNIGPLPATRYKLSSCKNSLNQGQIMAPCSFVLTPIDQRVMCGRDLFLIHGCKCCTLGDSTEPPSLGCSKGCIVINYQNRLRLRVGDTLIVEQYQKQKYLQKYI